MTRNTQKRGIWSSGWSEILIRMNLITWVQFPAAIYIADFCLVRKKSKRAPEKISTSVLLNMPKPSIVWITSNCGNFVKMGIPDHLTCLLRSLYAGQEATVRTGDGKIDWFHIGNGYVMAVYCHPAYLTYMQSTSCKMVGWMKHKLESRLLEEISTTSDTHRWHHPYGRKWRKTKEPLDESEREEWKSRLKA